MYFLLNLLSCCAQELPGINLWSLIKDWIGKDIHKLALPTHINEPLTDLQRRAEAFENSELLDEVRSVGHVLAILAPTPMWKLIGISSSAICLSDQVSRSVLSCSTPHLCIFCTVQMGMPCPLSWRSLYSI